MVERPTGPGGHVRPTSAAQHEASRRGTLPPLEQVTERVWSLALPMPGEHLHYSLGALLRDDRGGLHVLDPGWDTPEAWATLVAALHALRCGPPDVRSIVVTHWHPDHLGSADRLHAASGAPIVLHRAEQAAIDEGLERTWRIDALRARLGEWGVPLDQREELEALAGTGTGVDVTADVLVDDGDVLDIAGADVRVLWTPGHTSGSMCLVDDADQLLFTGDVLLPTMHSGLGLGGPVDGARPLTDHLASLQRLRSCSGHEVLPGHGYRFRGAGERAAQTAGHHLRRAAEVERAVHADGRSSIWKIATTLSWTAGWANLTGLYRFSALEQTAMHRAFVLDGALPGALATWSTPPAGHPPEGAEAPGVQTMIRSYSGPDQPGVRGADHRSG